MSQIIPSVTSKALSRLESVHYDEFKGGFERVGEGINTVGGMSTLNGQRVFVKVMDARSVQLCCFADEAMQSFGLPSLGMRAYQISMPQEGGAFPRFKFDGAVSIKTGLVHALVAPFLECGTICAFVAAKERLLESGRIKTLRGNKDAIMVCLSEDPEKYRSLLFAWAKSLMVRMVLGVKDYGPGNFLYDHSVNQVFAIDLSSCFSKGLDPREPCKKMLESNLFPDFAKDAMRALGVEESITTFVASWDVLRIRAELILLLAHYSLLAKEKEHLVNYYLMPNMTSAVRDFAVLLRSNKKRAAEKKNKEEGSSKR